jgi:hypothetical protein
MASRDFRKRSRHSSSFATGADTELINGLLMQTFSTESRNILSIYQYRRPAQCLWRHWPHGVPVDVHDPGVRFFPPAEGSARRLARRPRLVRAMPLAKISPDLEFTQYTKNSNVSNLNVQGFGLSGENRRFSIRDGTGKQGKPL